MVVYNQDSTRTWVVGGFDSPTHALKVKPLVWAVRVVTCNHWPLIFALSAVERWGYFGLMTIDL